MSDVNLGTATGTIQLAFNGAGSALAIASLGNVQAAAESAGAGLRNVALGMGLVGAAIDDALKNSIGSAVAYQAQITQLGVTTNNASLTAAQNAQILGQVKDGLRGIADTTPESIAGINGVANALAQQGIRGQAIVDGTQQIINLSKLSGVATSDLINPITKLVQNYSLGAEGIKAYSGALFEVSRQTTATIPNILDLQTKLEGASKALGLPIEQSLALAAGLAVVPAQGRQVVTTLNQLVVGLSNFDSMTTQVKQNIASVAGETIPKFADELQTQPLQAVNALLVGFANLHDGGQALGGIFDELGIKQTRQQLQLLNLAASQLTAAGSGNTLANTLAIVDSAFSATNVTQNAMQAITATSASQLTLLHNRMSELSIDAGTTLLPTLNFIVKTLGDFFTGVDRAVQVTGAFGPVILGVTGGVLTLGAAYLLLAPRLASAATAWGVLTGSAVSSTGATTEAGASAAAAGQEAGLASGGIAILVAQFDALLASLEIEGPTLVEEAGALEAMGAAAASAAPGVDELDAAMVALDAEVTVGSGGLNLIIPALVGLAAVLGFTLAGAATQSANSIAKVTDNINEGLLSAIQREEAGQKGVVEQWAFMQLAQDKVLSDLTKFGVSGTEIFAALTGSAQDLQNVLQKVRGAIPLSDTTDRFDRIAQSLNNLRQTFAATSAQAIALSNAADTAGGAIDTTGTAADAASQKVSALNKTMNELDRAAGSITSSFIGMQTAQNQVADAQEKLYAAQEQLANKAVLLQEAEDKVVVAEDNVGKASRQLKDDTIALADAQAKQAEDLVRAQLAVESSQLRLQSDTLSVADAQLKLNQLQNGGAANDYAKAIDALANAQLSLEQSTQGVADAQWQLNYLQQEGASPRDIADAKLALAAATNKEHDAQTAVNDANQKVQDLPLQQALALAKAQDAVSQSLIQEKQDIIGAHDAQVALLQAQVDSAQNSDYLDALDKVRADHLAIDQASITLTTDTEALHAIQNGSVERALTQAQIGLASAVVNLATQTTTYQADQDAANGTILSASDKASLFARNLGAVAQQAGPLGGLIATVAQQSGNLAAQAHAVQVQIDGMSNAIGVGDSAGGKGGAISWLQRMSDALDPLPQKLNNASNSSHGFWFYLGQDISNVGHSVTDFLSHLPGAGVAADIFNDTAGKAISAIGGIFGAEGGIYTSPTAKIIGEAGAEVLIPLTDPEQAWGLMQKSGLLGVVAGYMNSSYTAGTSSGGSYASAASGGSSSGGGGDTFNLTAITAASPKDIMDEFLWAGMVRR